MKEEVNDEDLGEYKSNRLLLNPNGSVKAYFPITPEMRYYDDKIESLEKRISKLDSTITWLLVANVIVGFGLGYLYLGTIGWV
jgi:hypothetical protein